jgi:choline kinase
MKLIILSAGKGTRLSPITDRKPKCLVKVGSKPILQHQIDLFLKEEGIEEIIVVVGYMSNRVEVFIDDQYSYNEKIKIIENEVYDRTNNMYSLYLALNNLDSEFLLINGDVLLEKEIADEFLAFKNKDAIAVDVGSYNEESMKVIEKNGFLVDISKKIEQKEAFGCSIDFYKFSSSGKEKLKKKVKEIIEQREKLNLWTELAIQELLKSGELEMKPFDINNKFWYEIDTHEDLEEARVKINKINQ